MTKHQVRVDLRDGTAKAAAVEIMEVVPGQEFYRAWDGSLRPVEGASLHSGDGWIVTGFHDEPDTAWAEAAAELERRMQSLAALRLVCLAGREVVHV
jgi:hypothetical protein